LPFPALVSGGSCPTQVSATAHYVQNYVQKNAQCTRTHEVHVAVQWWLVGARASGRE
jgi:hypothetical protein